MNDAALTWSDFGADITIINGDFSHDPAFATSVLISLFTDGRATPELLPEGENSLRGWWGDLDENDLTGSLLWLVGREKTTEQTATKAREYCRKALTWLTDYDIAEKYEVSTLIIKPQSLQITIKIYRGKAKQYAYLWENISEYDDVTIQNTSVKIEFIEQ